MVFFISGAWGGQMPVIFNYGLKNSARKSADHTPPPLLFLFVGLFYWSKFL
jgi:hypothetical protein